MIFGRCADHQPVSFGYGNDGIVRRYDSTCVNSQAQDHNGRGRVEDWENAELLSLTNPSDSGSL